MPPKGDDDNGDEQGPLGNASFVKEEGVKLESRGMPAPNQRPGLGAAGGAGCRWKEEGKEAGEVRLRWLLLFRPRVLAPALVGLELAFGIPLPAIDMSRP